MSEPAGWKKIGNSEVCGELERVRPAEKDQPFSGSVDCYLDLVLFLKKLEIFLNAASGL